MKSFGIPEPIHAYVVDRLNPLSDAVADDLAAATEEQFGALAGMNIGDDQGRFMQALVEMMGAMNVVEVGTFTGMSALWLARGLPAGGTLTCFELSEQYAETAIEAWEAAGVADRIEVRFGPAAGRLAELPEERSIDLAFIDADKGGYQTYLDLLLPRLSDRGAILVDNVLWGGAVLDDGDTSANTTAIRDFNDHVAQRTDCSSVILTLGDGITLIRPIR